MERTTIAVSKDLRDRLSERGNVNESYADVIERLLDEPTDSPHRNTAWLYYHYRGRGESISEMAERARVSEEVIRTWLDKRGIQKREE